MRPMSSLRLRRATVLAVIVAVGAGALAPVLAAQASEPAPPAVQRFQLSFIASPAAPRPVHAVTIGAATRASVAAAAAAAVPTIGTGQAASAPTSRGTTIAEDVLLGVGGALGGFFAGGFTGYGLDRYVLGGNHCACDDPGLKGTILGAFIGAIALPIILIHWLG
jgi:hypothetical protein